MAAIKTMMARRLAPELCDRRGRDSRSPMKYTINKKNAAMSEIFEAWFAVIGCGSRSEMKASVWFVVFQNILKTMLIGPPIAHAANPSGINVQPMSGAKSTFEKLATGWATLSGIRSGNSSHQISV